jgi:serine protease Do
MERNRPVKGSYHHDDRTRHAYFDEQKSHMTKRFIDLGMRTNVVFACLVATTLAASPRETPVVRAIKRAKAAVVNIESQKTAYGDESLFAGSKGRKVNGMGTGVVIDERGYIVTNHHVVAGVDSLRVTLVNGGAYTARVVSFDKAHDLAIIKIKVSQKLQIMPLGTSSDIMLGETVIAVGNAFGYKHTITSGIVSALGRNVEVNEKQAYKNLIQTDASINPGNSGGPLLNLEGEVVGINVAIRAGAQRIGFAIPIDDARRVIAKLLDVSKLDSTWHGLTSRDVKSGKSYKLIVDSADSGSPAAKAGFQSGDIVTKAGNIDVSDGVDFERAMLEHQAGDQVNVTVLRDGEQQTLALQLEKKRGNSSSVSGTVTVARANNNERESLAEKTWNVLGLKVGKLTDGTRTLTGPKYRGGMRVTEIRPNGPAAGNGIKRGDILVGLHIWETITTDNVSYVLDHPQLKTFGPLKFYILRGRETLYGHLGIERVAEK